MADITVDPTAIPTRQQAISQAMERHPLTGGTDAKASVDIRSWVMERLSRGNRLKETQGHVPPIAYFLTFAISGSAILLFGNADIPLLFSGDLPSIILATLRNLVIIIAVAVADRTVMRSYARIEPLRMREERGMVIEHYAYIGFVMMTNMLTFFMVSATNVQAITTGKMVTGIFGIPADWTMVILDTLKAILVGWTALQVLITGDKLLVQWNTILKDAAELLGGKGSEWLKSLNVNMADPASMFNAYGSIIEELSRPQKRVMTQTEKELLEDKAEARKTVIAALQGLTKGKDEEIARVITEKDQALMIARTAQENALASVEAVKQEMEKEIHRLLFVALMSIFAHGKLPDSFIEANPELADLDFAKVSKGSAKPVRTTGVSNTLPKPKDELAAALVSCNVDPSQVVRVWKKDLKTNQKVEKQGPNLRGIWVVAADIVAMSGNAIDDKEAATIVANAGEGFKYGVTYAAPAREVIKVLVRRNQIHSSLLEWYKAQDRSVKTPEVEQGEESTNDILVEA